jgi:hypothetical protein
LSVPEKTNEITAIPDLLDQLAETKQLEGALVGRTVMESQFGIGNLIEPKVLIVPKVRSRYADCAIRVSRKILADFDGIYQLGAKGRLIIGSSSGSDSICWRTGADV